ncbi:Predicted ATPase [Lentzea waywayandensis]|uniref:Predicted ATPase n=1 Tax=Lentzea waywayandensis TaxID=84724 RepID=A0A1I6FDT3_9PSEU|nr:tetratricopeptide repeat protein [Lentzea waywayandensis]SFR28080.1 Predicted ATPase [Lentzea waywayandensis]
MSAFAELLRRHRAAAGLSQVELARLSGISDRALRDLEQGRRVPRAQSARLMATALKLTGDDLTAFLAAARPSTPSAPSAPVSTDGLVGRNDELRSLLDLVLRARHRLVSITGPAGAGKSRLAAELAALLGGRTDLVVCTLDLSAVSDVALVGDLVADALGCGPSRLAPPDRVAAHLRDRRVVLVVDRFEQLVDAAAELAALPRRCPGLTVVVTSQRPLRVRDEHVLALSGLPREAAAALFVRRAGLEFADDAVHAICQKVEHLPLAIELAAGWVRLMSPADLATRLTHRLRYLTDGPRDLPARHRSLRAAIEATLDLVTAEARTTFRFLGGFHGGVRLEDLETLLGQPLPELTELVDINLVRLTPDGDTSRYTLPDTVAELAAEQLDSPDARIASHYLDRLRAGSTFGALDAANIRAAVRWAAAEDPTRLDAAAAMALTRFYEATGRLGEGAELLRQVGTGGIPPLLIRSGQLAALRGDLDAAGESAERALAVAADDDHSTRTAGLSLLGMVAVERGNPGAALAHLRQALAVARLSGDDATLGRVLNNLSSALAEIGRPQQAIRQLEAALAAKRRAGAGPFELGRTLFNLALLALDVGALETTVSRAAESVRLLTEGGHTLLAALAETTAALALLDQDPAAAAACVHRADRLLADTVGENGNDRVEATVHLRASVVRHALRDATAWRELAEAMRISLSHTTRDRDSVAEALTLHARYLCTRDPGSAAVLLGSADRLRRKKITPFVAAARDHALAVLGDRWSERLGRALDDAALVAFADEIAARSPR